jgi:glycine cleavage system H protein
VKSVNDFYSPIDGTVVAINESLREMPQQVNSDPLGAGWFAKVRSKATAPLHGLLSAADYQSRITA